MMKNERMRQILALLEEQEAGSVADLAKQFQVSKETLRRDLRQLQAQGKLLRQHGKATLIQRDVTEAATAFSDRSKSHTQRKRELVEQALAWLSPGMTLALDASSTCWHLAKRLPNSEMTVVTNSFRICYEVEKKTRITLICCGGWLDRKSASYRHDLPLALLKDLDLDLFIFSCDGIDNEGNIWDSGGHNAPLKQLMLKRAAQSLLLIDKSKMGRKSVVTLGHIDAVTTVIKG
ncbi:L-fucose operon activator [Paramixta manurensis]|uniref:L-fucose operon activator n=1 Tax=Paramixta manurensis TaxID=2740817 RepID=A0A6M8UET7_9GAMM|nr:L-fucose operon activator [Erwiniaceae bacterium PD-1]